MALHISKSFIIFSTILVLAACQSTNENSEPYAPVRYTGQIQPSKYFYDGAIRHAVGTHHYQVSRANRSFPDDGINPGYTYNHQPYLAYWKGKFYLQFLRGQVEEHTPPTRIVLCTSEDGRTWTKPITAFPVYTLPEINNEKGYLPAGTKSVLHQRMGFYTAPNGRLLISGFYSYCYSPRYSPNKGQGLGRVVREIYEDGGMGPVYFVRYNRHAGWSEDNTSLPFYKESQDKDFLEACESLLNDKVVTLQWWEEDRAEDGFYIINPGDVDDPDKNLGAVTTSAGAGKAPCFFHRKDGLLVGIWKNQWSGLSTDEGQTWQPLTRATSLNTCGAKVWAQENADGNYSLVYNHSATRRNRFPLVVLTGPNGENFDQMLCVQGEVPPKRYQGIHKNPGPQYVRGIMEGNGNPPGDEMWHTYSMNKEDIWVTRNHVPVVGNVNENVDEDFNDLKTESDLTYWNLYMPIWAPIQIVEKGPKGDNCIQISDMEPYDFAKAERAFPVSKMVDISFQVKIDEIAQGHALEIEVQNEQGKRPMRLRLDQSWLGLDRAKVFPLEPVSISAQKWYHIGLYLDCSKQNYNLLLNNELIRENVAFAQEVKDLERIVFRTGPYRNDVRPTVAETGEPKPAGLYSEDLPGSEMKTAPSVYLIDDVKIMSN